MFVYWGWLIRYGGSCFCRKVFSNIRFRGFYKITNRLVRLINNRLCRFYNIIYILVIYKY